MKTKRNRKKECGIGDIVLTKHKFFLINHQISAEVISIDRPYWGIFGKRYLLRALARWTDDNNRIQTDYFTKYRWQFTAF